jgi:hypothetical protein
VSAWGELRDDDAAASVRAADLRAIATFAVGIGFLHLAGPQPSVFPAADREGFLDIMLKS